MEKYRVADALYESKTARAGKRSLGKINSIIIHTTGYGAGLKRLKKANEDAIGNLNKVALGKIGKGYAKRMATILKYKGHFLIDHTGVIYQFLPLKEIGWHTGSGKRIKLKRDEPFDWWVSRWPDYKRPTDLPSWVENSPNKVSIGIDLLAHGNGALTSGYTEQQYESLTRLIKALCEDLKIDVERKLILGHEDVDPISRGSKRSGWDPGAFDWDKLMNSLKEESDPVEIPIDVEEPPPGEFEISIPDPTTTDPAPLPFPKTAAGSFFKFLNKFLSLLRG
jgi:hypothetical protein